MAAAAYKASQCKAICSCGESGPTAIDAANTFDFRMQLVGAVIERAMNERTNAVVIASKVGVPWEYGMSIFVQDYQDGLRNIDKETGLYPFMLSACSSFHNNANLDTVYQTLMACPDIIIQFGGKGAK